MASLFIKYRHLALLVLALLLPPAPSGSEAEVAIPTSPLGLGAFGESVRDFSSFTLLPLDLTASAPTLNPRGHDEPPLALGKVGGIAALRLSTESPVSPYVGAGLNTIEGEQESVLETFAHREEGTRYQLGAGVGVDLGKSTRLGLDYRYTPAADSSLLDAASPDEAEGERHRISFGLEFLF